MNVNIFIVHYCGVIGGIYATREEAEQKKRKGWRELDPSLKSLIRIHTPQEYGDYCVEQGKMIAK